MPPRGSNDHLGLNTFRSNFYWGKTFSLIEPQWRINRQAQHCMPVIPAGCWGRNLSPAQSMWWELTSKNKDKTKKQNRGLSLWWSPNQNWVSSVPLPIQSFSHKVVFLWSTLCSLPIAMTTVPNPRRHTSKIHSDETLLTDCFFQFCRIKFNTSHMKQTLPNYTSSPELFYHF